MGKFAAMEGQAGFGVGLTTIFQSFPSASSPNPTCPLSNTPERTAPRMDQNIDPSGDYC